MKKSKHKNPIPLFTFLLSLFTTIITAQTGLSPATAIIATDAYYDQSFSIQSIQKETWHKFKVMSSSAKDITVTTTNLNPLNRIDLVQLYTGTASTLQLVKQSYPISSTDSIAAIFLDSNAVAINDTIFLRLITTTNTGCALCPDNNTVNYRLIISEIKCNPAVVTLNSHFPFTSGSFCNITNNNLASACTLKVCAGEAVCLTTLISPLGFPACGPGILTMPSLVSSTPVTVTSGFNGASFFSNYCFTATNTPGIFLLTLCWTHYPTGYNCNGEPMPGEGRTCCGSFYLEVGPPAPVNLGYTINPNPVCIGSSACFTSIQANTPGYTYSFVTNGSSGAILNTTGIACDIYYTAGTFTTGLTIYNGYCPSREVVESIKVIKPSVTANYVQNNCRNYTFNALPSCLPANVTYTWNIAGVTYSGSPLTINIPGNSASVPITLTASGSGINPSLIWNSTITNIPTLSASIVTTTDGCGNVTFTGTPNLCMPTNAIYTWTNSFGGIVHIGNPATISVASGINQLFVNLTVTDVNGTVLYTSGVQTYNISPQTIPCCPNNTQCLIGDVACTPIVWSGSLTLTTANYYHASITVMPNTIVTLASGATVSFSNCTFLFNQGSGFQLSRTFAGLTFFRCYLHGCKNLWEGIKFVNTGAIPSVAPTVNFINSLMEDAVVGFDFANNSDYVNFNVNHVIFNKNITAIKFRNKPSSGVFGNYNTLNINDVVFSCRQFTLGFNNFLGGQASYNLPGYGNAPLASPYTKIGFPFHQKSLIGISVEGVGGLGLNTFAGNASQISISEDLIYDNLVQGIAIKGLNLAPFKGNTFKNITSPLAGGDYPTYYTTQSAAIYYSGKAFVGSGNLFAVTAVGPLVPAPPQRNTFTNCYYGVYAKDEPIDVTRNDFNDCYNGVYIAFANVPSASNSTVNCNLVGNNFVRLKYTGFTLNKNVSINLEMKANNLNNTTGLNFTSRGVDIIEVNNPVSAKYVVFNNLFKNLWCGTRAVNTYNPVFTNNKIELNTSNTFSGVTPNNALYNTGISLTNCEMPQVNENEILNTSNLNTWWEGGITTVDSRNGSYYCNEVDGTFSSINTGAACPGTLIYRNDFSNAKFAHWLIFANVIGYQYNPNLSSAPTSPGFPPSFVQPADNRYYNISPLHSYTQNGTDGLLNAQFFVRGNNTFNPFALNNNGFESSSSSSPIAFPAILNFVFPYNNSGCNVGPPNGRLMSFAKQIALDSLYQSNDNRNRFVSRRQLLTNLQKENIGTTGDADIDNFPANNNSNAVGKFNNADNLTQQGVDNADSTYFIQAETINNSVAPADSIELLQKQVNLAYIFYLRNNGNLDATQIATLQPIAALCPYRYGISIWQARALLVGFDFTHYFNDCEFYSAADDVLNARMAQSIENLQGDVEVPKILVYPNPNAGSFKIELPMVNTEVTIDVINTFGGYVKQLKHKAIEGNTTIDVKDLDQGLYFIIVKQNGVTVGSNKVIVAK